MKKTLRGYRFQTDPDTKHTPTDVLPRVQNSLQQKSDTFVSAEESGKHPHLPHNSIIFQN